MNNPRELRIHDERAYRWWHALKMFCTKKRPKLKPPRFKKKPNPKIVIDPLANQQKPERERRLSQLEREWLLFGPPPEEVGHINNPKVDDILCPPTKKQVDISTWQGREHQKGYDKILKFRKKHKGENE